MVHYPITIEHCILKPGTHNHSLLVRGWITIMFFTRVAKDCLLIPRVVHERMGIRQKEGYIYHHLMILRRVYLTFRGTNLYLILLNGWFYCLLLRMKWSDTCLCILKSGSWIVPPVCMKYTYTKLIKNVILTWFILFHIHMMYDLYIYKSCARIYTIHTNMIHTLSSHLSKS
jgi:hypothetical protein